MIDWRDMPEFVGVDLEDSWILGWCHDIAGRRLTFDLEASLWPGHPAYDTPSPGEWTCYRVATLAFEEVSVSGLLAMGQARSTVDPDGSRDYECLYGLRREGNVFRFEGDMGDVTVHAGAVRLALKGHAPAG